jgi:hypothetical protein
MHGLFVLKCANPTYHIMKGGFKELFLPLEKLRR